MAKTAVATSGPQRYLLTLGLGGYSDDIGGGGGGGGPRAGGARADAWWWRCGCVVNSFMGSRL